MALKLALSLDELFAPKGVPVKQLLEEWLPPMFVVVTPFLGWLLGDLNLAISMKIDDDEWTIGLSKNGLKIETGLRDDALATVIMAEKDFLRVATGEMKIAIMPPSGKMPDLTQMPARVKETVEKLREIEAVIKVRLEDPIEGDFVAKMKFAGPMLDEPTTEVTLPLDVLEGMGTGAYNPASAFILDGLLKVEGDVDLLMKLAMMMM